MRVLNKYTCNVEFILNPGKIEDAKCLTVEMEKMRKIFFSINKVDVRVQIKKNSLRWLVLNGDSFKLCTGLVSTVE